MPELEYTFSEQIASNIQDDYAMMDTSDGLMDAVFKIAEASNTKIILNYDKIPHKKNIAKELVLYGGEDYKLVAAVPKSFLINLSNYDVIGYVYDYDGTRVQIDDMKFSKYEELNVYNHFGE